MKEVRVRLGRSRSSPLGRIISLIEPLASGKERRSQLHTQETLLFLPPNAFLFVFFLFSFFFLNFFPPAPLRLRPESGWSRVPETAALHLATTPREGEKRSPNKPTQQTRKEGAMEAQGPVNNPLSPFENWV